MKDGQLFIVFENGDQISSNVPADNLQFVLNLIKNSRVKHIYVTAERVVENVKEWAKFYE